VHRQDDTDLAKNRYDQAAIDDHPVNPDPVGNLARYQGSDAVSADRYRLQRAEHIGKNLQQANQDIAAAGRESEDAAVTDRVAQHLAHIEPG
jgi:hypothetical protein